MDLLLVVKLFFSLFSFNPRNMRWFNVRRIIVSFFLLPVFIILFLSNRLFMLLDYVFFARFVQIKIAQPIFIISAPRSATTYLFHKLSSLKNKTTTFKLWELVFAPSIIQKYLVLMLAGVDAFLGKPLQRLIAFFEQFLLGDFRKIHPIGLNLPEEDEAILLWNFTSIYFNFFFPDTHYFDDYFLFDDRLKPSLRNKIMRYYFRCVQRHCFVFNPDNKKHFLSKNPAMMSKIRSLHDFFPDALIFNINRCPSMTIPSTIALNNNIYGFFTSRKASGELNERTKKILINWYKFAHENLNSYYSANLIVVDFDKLTAHDEETLNNICNKLDINKSVFIENQQNKDTEIGNKSLNKYSSLEPDELKEILYELPFLTQHCK